MKRKTLTETITEEELKSCSATASYMDFGLGGSGSGSGFGGGGYKGGSSFGSAGLKLDLDVPSIKESFSFKPDARGPLDEPIVDYAKALSRIDSSFASSAKNSPSSFGSKYDPTSMDEINRILEDSKRNLEILKSVTGLGVSSSFGSALEQGYRIKSSHDERGLMTMHRSTGDCLHLFEDGEAHIDLGSKHKTKLTIEKNLFDRYDNPISKKIKGTGGFF